MLKLLAGFSLGLLYTYYYTERYTADTFKYFDDGMVLYSVLKSDPVIFFKLFTGVGEFNNEMQVQLDRMNNWYDTFSPFNDNRSMIRFNALLAPLTFGYYYAHVVFISFLSFTGLVSIVKTFGKYHQSNIKEFFLVFVILPSTLFWCSGLLKDSLAFFVLGTLIYSIDQFNIKAAFDSLKFMKVLFLFLLLMITKFQIFLLLFPVLSIWLFISKFRSFPIKPTLIYSGLFFVCLIFFDLLFNNSGIVYLLHAKQSAFFQLAIESDAGSFISIPRFERIINSLFAVIPHGMFTGIFRPYFLDSKNILMLISGLENTVILLLAIYLLAQSDFKKIKTSPVAVFSIYFSISFFTLIGIMTPVLGALVRYKALALPFFVVFFIIIANENKSILSRACKKLKI